MPLHVPIVDLSSDEHLLVQQLEAACCRGFFFLASHGVPQPAISAALEALRQFFALAPASKQALAHNSHAKGYMSWGQQTLDLAVQSCGDTKETWAVMDSSLSVAADDPAAFNVPFHSPNQWPAELPHFRATIEELVGHMKRLRDRVNPLLARVLGQPPDFFASSFSPTSLDMLRGFHYHSKEGSDPDRGVLGAGAHTDWGHLTYLMTDACPGLQIQHQGAWQDVPHVTGAFVCNVADLLQLWSGGRFKSARHRVVVAPGVHRYSCAYFTVPAWDAWVQPLTLPAPTPTQGDAEAATATAKAATVGAATAASEVAPGTTGTASPAGGSSAVVVSADGCSLAPGAAGVRVLDYIAAKYSFHFKDAGQQAAQ